MGFVTRLLRFENLSEDKCRDIFERHRWPLGVECPICRGPGPIQIQRRRGRAGYFRCPYWVPGREQVFEPDEVGQDYSESAANSDSNSSNSVDDDDDSDLDDQDEKEVQWDLEYFDWLRELNRYYIATSQNGLGSWETSLSDYQILMFNHLGKKFRDFLELFDDPNMDEPLLRIQTGEGGRSIVVSRQQWMELIEANIQKESVAEITARLSWCNKTDIARTLVARLNSAFLDFEPEAQPRLHQSPNVFSVRAGTVMSSSNLNYLQWAKVLILFAHRAASSEIARQANISTKSAKRLVDRLHAAFPGSHAAGENQFLISATNAIARELGRFTPTPN